MKSKRGKKLRFLSNKSQPFKEGVLFVGLFFVTAASIGLYQILHASPNVQVTTLSAPQSSSNQLTPYYSISVSSSNTISTDSKTHTKRVTVDVAIVNPSSTPMQIAPGLQMLVVDDAGVAYPMTAKYLPVGTVVGGQLNPKTTKSYNVDFELPVNSTPKYFNFQLDASYKPLQVQL